MFAMMVVNEKFSSAWSVSPLDTFLSNCNENKTFTTVAEAKQQVERYVERNSLKSFIAFVVDVDKGRIVSEVRKSVPPLAWKDKK